MKLENKFMWIIAGTLLMVLATAPEAMSQTDKEKQRARMSMSYTNHNNDALSLTAVVKTKVDRSYENVSGVEVNFYQSEIGDDYLLGSAVSNADGEATLMLPDSIKRMLTKEYNTKTFIAAIENSDQFRDADTDISITSAQASLDLFEEDTIRYARLFVGSADSSGSIMPVSDVTARIYVKRLFGNLPVSEEFESTDEEGYLITEFPDDLPGDEEGMLEVIAQVRDHSEFGNLTVSGSAPWGTPVTVDEDALKGELWSARANAPMYLIIMVNAMLIGIWGTLIYIVIKLFKINQLGYSD